MNFHEQDLLRQNKNKVKRCESFDDSIVCVSKKYWSKKKGTA